MQGQGAVRHFEHLIADPENRAAFQHLQDGQGNWAERDDVFVYCIGRNKQGPLSTGFGRDDERVGPEPGFGHVIGDALDEPVLIIKTCRGGHSLKKDYLPPSSGVQGGSCGELVTRLKNLSESRDETFPNFEGREFRLAGFVWFQGWNDMVDGEQRTEFKRGIQVVLRRE